MFRKILEDRLRKGPILKRLRNEVFKASTRIVDVATLDGSLQEDIKNSSSHIVIFSPFLTINRVKLFLSMKTIIDALKRGIRVAVVTRPAAKRWVAAPEEQRECIKMLSENNIKVVEVEALHFKAVIIDDKIIYLGSINVLSILPIEYYPPDYMIRFESEALVDEIVENVLGKEKYYNEVLA
uniref:PLD phosphodiesterase domain-containing protein n=1 Tax=Ignisphaera aggregans TaxID=334771 RepID=A0A7C5UU46_9CREN